MTNPSTLSIDHLLYVAADLDAAARRLRRDHGLDAVAGGAHPDWGTGNLIVPVGEHFIELFAVTDRRRAEANPVGRWLLAAAAQGDGPRAVCLRSCDFAGDAARLGFSIEPGERVYADGRRIFWRQAGVREAMATGMPFFLFDWPAASAALRLGGGAPDHAAPMAGIASVTIASPTALPDLGGAVRVVAGAAPSLREAVLERADGGTIRLTGAG